jgi:hypothetical protein
MFRRGAVGHGRRHAGQWRCPCPCRRDWSQPCRPPQDWASPSLDQRSPGRFREIPWFPP